MQTNTQLAGYRGESVPGLVRLPDLRFEQADFGTSAGKQRRWLNSMGEVHPSVQSVSTLPLDGGSQIISELNDSSSLGQLYRPRLLLARPYCLPSR
jgi:hypothetical protein